MKNILVVDDEISLVQLCEIILREAGFKVRGAVNGKQALRMFAEQKPDLILLDVMMPGMDGIEVCRRIREQKDATQPLIVMYTADERDCTRNTSLEAGANDVVTKQTPVFELPRRIASIVSQGMQPLHAN